MTYITSRRRAKMLCTLGPSSNTYETIHALAEAGMDAARLNFSHSSHDDHRRTYELVLTTRKVTGAAVIICLTQTGSTAKMIARFRPGTLIIAITPRPETCDQLPII